MLGIQTSNESIFELIDGFERDLRSGKLVDLRAYFPNPSTVQFEEGVTEILRIWLEWEWGKGHQDALAKIIKELPEIVSYSTILKGLVYEDRRLHRVYGLVVSREYYLNLLGNHFPNFESPSFVESLLGVQSNDVERSSRSVIGDTARDIEPITSPISCTKNIDPNRNFEPNEELGDFRLLQLLGHGAFSRVYLASQKSLANRIVVLKITSLPMGESQKLARLQHSNIVPLYSAQNVDGFFLLCMPFLGSITLRDAIHFAKKKTDSQIPNQAFSRLTGNDLVSAITADKNRLLKSSLDVRQFISSEDSNTDIANPISEKWKTNDSIQTALRIAIELTTGLEYAHSRGLLHGDIKPANVLLGFDGSVMLLDFNLSRSQTPSVDRRTSAGGTLPYMAPEQLLGLLESKDCSSISSDIYSIGVVLYELLTGKTPVDFNSLNNAAVELSIERHRQTVNSPDSLNREVSKDLSTIVMKCLAKDPSHRYQSVTQLREDLFRQHSDQPLKFAPNRSFRERIAKYLRRNRASLQFASWTLLSLCAIVTLLSTIHLWVTSVRGRSANQTYASFKTFARNAEASLFFADGGSREEGKELGKKAIACFYPTNASSREYLIPYLNHVEQADVHETVKYLGRLIEHQPTQYLLAPNSPENLSSIEYVTQLYFKRELDEALELLQTEIAKNPNRFISWFLQGQILLEQRRYQEACTAFTVAESTEPNCAITWLAKGNCFYWMGQYDKALQCYKHAEDIDASLASLWYNRSLVYEKLQSYTDAVRQLEKAIQLAPGSHRYGMALSRNLRAVGRTADSEQIMKALSKETPKSPEDWLFRGLSFLPTSPQEALKDFEKAQTYDSLFFVAGQNKAHVLSEYLKRTDDAIQVLTEMLERDPGYAPALTGRAVLFARSQKRDLALADLEQCNRLNPSAQIHYQMGCAYALLATGSDRQKMQEQAFEHLARALTPGYGGSLLAIDHDLDNLRENERFRTILNGVNTIQKVAK